MKEKGLSLRRSCALVKSKPSNILYKMRVRDDAAIMARIKTLAQKHKRFGYRRVYIELQKAGEIINHKKVFRLWQIMKLSLPKKRPRKKMVKTAANGLQSQFRNHVWTYDFMFDRLNNGRKIKVLMLQDEFTREGIAIKISDKIRAEDLQCILCEAFRKRGAPLFIRSDNGPEFVEKSLKKWLKFHGTETIHIEPGHPWQNGKCESFNSKARDEFFNMEVFLSMREAQVKAEIWRNYYNKERPHSSLGYLTPDEFARLATTPRSAPLHSSSSPGT